MSYSISAYIWCDEPDCLQWVYAGEQLGRRDARQLLRSSGWAFAEGRDLCPDHNPKATAEQRQEWESERRR